MSGISGVASIGSIGNFGGSNSITQGVRQRPDGAKLADTLFSKLDTAGQGYIGKSDLQAAFDGIASSSSSASGASDSTSTVDELFAKLDTDSDGKVSRQEFTDTLNKLQSQLESQLQDGRIQSALQAAGLPPPPQGDGPTLSKDELASALSQTDKSDSRSKIMSDILENFDAADANGDGKVSFQEATAYQQSSAGSSNLSSASLADSGAGASSSSSSGASDAIVMMQIAKLIEAYGIGDESGQGQGALSSLSVSV